MYLEDLEPDGTVRYVTEGVLRLIHRNTQPAAAPFRFPTPYRTFATADAVPLTPSEVVKFEFSFHPISYLFGADHRMRIAISGADANHFTMIPEKAPLRTLYHDSGHPSAITLPVMRR